MSKQLFKKINNANFLENVNKLSDPPNTVITFIARLNLLYGVPFNYLVPDSNILPPESLKFFTIDPQWINALLGGALSVGRIESKQVLLNKAKSGIFSASIINEMRRLRQQSHSSSSSDTETNPGVNTQLPDATNSFSGFLLRSRILEGWKGTEIRAYSSENNQGNKELLFIRSERLAPDILFGLVDGQLKQLEITQPKECLHFAVEDPSNVDKETRKIQIEQLKGYGSGSAALAKENVQNPVRFVFQIGE